MFSEHVSKAMSNKQQLDVIYTSCANAYDKVSFCVMIEKLADLGLSGESLWFLTSYLISRVQRVKIRNISIQSICCHLRGTPGQYIGPSFVFNLY